MTRTRAGVAVHCDCGVKVLNVANGPAYIGDQVSVYATTRLRSVGGLQSDKSHEVVAGRGRGHGP